MSDAPSGSCQIAFVLRLPEVGNATGPDDAAPDVSTGTVAPAGWSELESRLTVKRSTATQMAPPATRMPFVSALTGRAYAMGRGVVVSLVLADLALIALSRYA